ncbi:hypothetical protein H5410_014093 [Solanum commersonii]|uniref:Ubiquitin-like protease family profile domain-containing protein n=1 Tax=Solanum commersonii TaxID=4109 RepID=A0A9J5ZPY3_SOLCO|nr:hypothetical protein H5410_014093 [Solanum commersonii]
MPQSKLKVVFIKNVHQQDPSSNDCGLYTYLVKCISNGVFDMGLIHIDAKYHCKRYATIMWQYGRSKNVDGTISESEVTEMVASKFGGPRIAKEYALGYYQLSYTKTKKMNFGILDCSLDFQLLHALF